MKFENRREAGRLLTHDLFAYKDTNTTVLAILRGGVPVGFELAAQLNLRLDIFLVRKLGYPGHGEFAIGAIASGGSNGFQSSFDAKTAERLPEMCT